MVVYLLRWSVAKVRVVMMWRNVIGIEQDSRLVNL